MDHEVLLQVAIKTAEFLALHNEGLGRLYISAQQTPQILYLCFLILKAGGLMEKLTQVRW